jgi:hypothetical protein
MKKFLCLIAGLLLIAGCATKKISKTSFMGAMKQTDFCEKFPCSKYGLSKEKVSALVVECWEQEMENLPPMFTKRQLDEIKPSVELCAKYKAKTWPIISKSDLLYTLANKDFYDDYPKAAEFGITRLQLNNLVMDCVEQGMETLPSEFSINQFEEIEPEFKVCASNKIKAEVKIPKTTFIKILSQKDLLNKIPESAELIELGIDMGEMQKLIVDCFKQESKSLPSRITLNQFEELEPNAESCFMDKIKTTAIIPKTLLINKLNKIVNKMDWRKEYPKAAEYGVDRKQLKKIVMSCFESEMKDLPSKISYNRLMALKALEPHIEACIDAKMVELSLE